MPTERVVRIMGRDFVEVGLVCPDCGQEMRLAWSPVDRPPWYACERWPTCRAIHGARWDGRPMGTPADAATRLARRQAHEAFDLLWKSGRMSRVAAYRWLAARLGMPTDRAHISQFSADDCARVVAICAAWAPLLGRSR